MNPPPPNLDVEGGPQDTGVPASPSGSQASPGAAKEASPPPVSILNAELLAQVKRVHRAAIEPHPPEETSDRCDAVTMQNANAHAHNQWVRRISRARLDLLPLVAELVAQCEALGE